MHGIVAVLLIGSVPAIWLGFLVANAMGWLDWLADDDDVEDV